MNSETDKYLGEKSTVQKDSGMIKRKDTRVGEHLTRLGAREDPPFSGGADILRLE